MCFPNSRNKGVRFFKWVFPETGVSCFAQCQIKYKRGRLDRERLHRSRDFKITRMKTFAVLILAFSCCLCEVQVNENNDKVRHCSGSGSCCDIYSLTSISQNLGAVEEKVANMAEKITLLDASLQNTEKDVLELRSLIGGKIEQMFLWGIKMGYNSSLYKFLPLMCSWSFDACRHTSGGLFCSSEGFWLWRHWTFHHCYPTAV